MPWLVGIDEAGYGPNLGPLVMTSVACRVPTEVAQANLWQVLRPAVRRARAQAGERLLIEDSKVVYSTVRGLAELERGVLATVLPALLNGPSCVSRSVELLCPHAQTELAAERWYTGTSALPAAAATDDCSRAAERFQRASERKDVSWGPVRSEIVCPTRFNGLLDRWHSKGAVLGEALASLLRAHLAANGDAEPVTFLIDKHGGRNTYAALLQHALPEALVQAEEEGPQRSLYQLHGLGREVRILFTPRADASHFGVALASMVSKYVREVLMREFNAFWQTHVPGLRPTAGYPGDAGRFFAEIRPALERLGLAKEAVWRRK